VKPVLRFVLGTALLVLVVLVGGALTMAYPFLYELGVSPLEALWALLGGGR
jgi:hypothetical protein